MSDPATKTNLSYHRHLEGIVAEDVRYVRDKDTKYNASWKQRGGVGAYFTIVRPLDRMLNMLDPTRMPGDQREAPMAGWRNSPIPAYDMFAGIEAEGLEGPDGSLIACVRDLRRYLLLVEAHMTEEIGSGATAEPPRLVDLAGMDFSEVEKRILEWMNSSGGEGGDFEDMYLKVAGELGITRQEAKARVLKALYGGPWPAGYEGPDVTLPSASGGMVEPLRNLSDEVAVILTNTPRVGETADQTLARSVEGRAELARRGEPKGPISWERSVPRYADDRGPWPWIASWARVSALPPQCHDAWHRSGKDTMHLEPRLTQQLWEVLPPEVRQCYSAIVPDEQDSAAAYWLHVWLAPEGERDRWRTLASELNHAEWQGAMEYAELYEWREGPGKYILRNDWWGWKAQ